MSIASMRSPQRWRDAGAGAWRQARRPRAEVGADRLQGRGQLERCTSLKLSDSTGYRWWCARASLGSPHLQVGEQRRGVLPDEVRQLKEGVQRGQERALPEAARAGEQEDLGGGQRDLGDGGVLST
jgi:hypothetical protein